MSKPRDKPFPGMDPYMEDTNDFHLTFLVYASAVLQKQLPDKLRCEVESDEVYPPPVDSEDTEQRCQSEGPVDADQQPPFTKPALRIYDPLPRRWLAVRDESGAFVSALTLVRQRDKENHGAVRYGLLRDRFREQGASLVEIDLCRQGGLAAPMFEEDIAVGLADRGESPAYSVTRCVQSVRQKHSPRFEFLRLSFHIF